MCVYYNVTLACLTENFIQTHDLIFPALYDVTKYAARSDTRKLIGISD